MFDERLHELTERHLRRRIQLIQSATGPLVTIDGRTTILMASNNYLGLATHPALKHAAIQATEQFGVGSGASRLVSGTQPPHHELEMALARFKGTESALIFSSGYLANLGLVSILMERGGLIVADRLCHASLIDGCRLSRADFRVFRHRDLSHLEMLLAKRGRGPNTLIVTDGIFSMDGDAAPLLDLLNLADRYGARVLVDDAHGTGVMGRGGRGTLEHFGVDFRLPFHMGTLSKALGTSGAYVAGPASLIELLANTARSFIYTTSLPPATAAASVAALHILRNEPDRRSRLWENRHYFYHRIKALGFRLTDTVSPIIPVLIGDAQKAVTMADRLLHYGVYAPAIRPPTVPRDTSRIRTTVTSEHTREQLDRVVSTFHQAGQELGII
ncbi:MAG TPA: 8-amino-7-oxononanoate synthase [Nitrospiraceae bacterium]|nr:8-amino-7-oxononanoate synthase [Nitrospiraceae bacterium]